MSKSCRVGGFCDGRRRLANCGGVTGFEGYTCGIICFMIRSSVHVLTSWVVCGVVCGVVCVCVVCAVCVLCAVCCVCAVCRVEAGWEE